MDVIIIERPVYILFAKMRKQQSKLVSSARSWLSISQKIKQIAVNAIEMRNYFSVKHTQCNDKYMYFNTLNEIEQNKQNRINRME